MPAEPYAIHIPNCSVFCDFATFSYLDIIYLYMIRFWYDFDMVSWLKLFRLSPLSGGRWVLEAVEQLQGTAVAAEILKLGGKEDQVQMGSPWGVEGMRSRPGIRSC